MLDDVTVTKGELRMRPFFLIVLASIIALTVVGCGRKGESRSNLTVKGSNTMLQLGQAWAEDYNGTSSTKVSVSGEGSGVGISSLISGTTDIAECSREMKPDEIKQAEAKGVEPVSTIVAWDGLAVIVNKNNTVKQLTMDQLRDIFMGTTKNWREVGGPDLPIELVNRDTSSGTHEYFLEHVLRRGNSKGKEDFPNTALVVTSSQAAAQTVAQDEGAVAYVGLGYVTPKVSDIAVAKAQGSPYVKPTVTTVLDSSYPISRPLYFYTNGSPKSEVKKYVDFVLDDKGQQIVEKQGFVPVPKQEAK
jgi:phosphate transport system substrate-binding protein